MTLTSGMFPGIWFQQQGKQKQKKNKQMELHGTKMLHSATYYH